MGIPGSFLRTLTYSSLCSDNGILRRGVGLFLPPGTIRSGTEDLFTCLWFSILLLCYTDGMFRIDLIGFQIVCYVVMMKLMWYDTLGLVIWRLQALFLYDALNVLCPVLGI